MSNKEENQQKNVLLIMDYDGTISYKGTNNPKHLKNFLKDIKMGYPAADIDIALCSGRPLPFLQGIAQFLGRKVKYIAAEAGGLTARVNPETGDLQEIEILASKEEVELIQKLQKHIEPKFQQLGLQFELGKMVGFTIKHAGAGKSHPTEEEMKWLKTKINLLVEHEKTEGHIHGNELEKIGWVLTPDSFDGSPQSVDKANAIMNILETAYRGNKAYDIVIFSGDSANDIPARNLLLSDEFQKTFNIQSRVIGPKNAKKEYIDIDGKPSDRIIIGDGNGIKGTGLAFNQAMKEFGIVYIAPEKSKIGRPFIKEHDDKSNR